MFQKIKYGMKSGIEWEFGRFAKMKKKGGKWLVQNYALCV